jgi:hypothetical protein
MKREEVIEWEGRIDYYQKKVLQFEYDCLTLALRLYGEDYNTFSPETMTVMDRWRPRCEEALRSKGI